MCLGEGYAELGFRSDGSCAGARAAPVLREDLLRSVQKALALQRCCSQHCHLCPELSHLLRAWQAGRMRSLLHLMTARYAAWCQGIPGSSVHAALASALLIGLMADLSYLVLDMCFLCQLSCHGLQQDVPGVDDGQCCR